jgi:isocitrate/isopropylmalate dehydrogenase
LAGAQRIRRAIESVFADPANRTPDMGGRLTTGQMTEKIIARL